MEDNADADYMQKDFVKICKSLSWSVWSKQ